MKHIKFNTLIFFNISIMLFCPKSEAQERLGIATYRLYYDFVWELDTLKYNDTREDLIVLLIGKEVSKSFSYYAFREDSLRDTYNGEVVIKQMILDLINASKEPQDLRKGFLRGGMGNKVYKNYPEGQMTVTDNISTNYYMYKEDYNSQNWQILDTTKTILGYSSQMAISDFRGRQWIAWFAHDIPISDGPWKFSGLPGLIMEVYDSEKHFHFTLVGMEQVDNEPIVFSPVVLGYRSYGNYEETTRLTFLRGLVRYLWNSSAIMNAELGRVTFDETSNRTRSHDLIERDYR